jgi:transcriptional regulator NrdR family protein
LSQVTVIKRDGRREEFDANKINLAIEEVTRDLDPNTPWVTQIGSELALTLFDGISTQQLDESVIQVALQNVKDDPAYDKVAARLYLKSLYKSILGQYRTAEELKNLHAQKFEETVRMGVEAGLLEARFMNEGLFDFDKLANALEPENDENFIRLTGVYSKCAVNIVTETQYDCYPGIVTEKTMMAFAAQQVPVVIGHAGIVQHCKNLGFDMFEDLVDTSYDTLPNSIRLEQALALNQDLIQGKIDLSPYQQRLRRNREYLLDGFLTWMENRFKHDCQRLAQDKLAIHFSTFP